MINRTIYKWKRFWCERDNSIDLSDEGFLYDPEAEYGNIINKAVFSFESISSTPCLALLGEPGIGKSKSLQSEKDSIKNKVKGTGDSTLWLDLRSFGSEDRLINSLIKDGVFISWEKGNHKLYIFLDSLDECLLKIDTIATLLVDELKKYPIERLYLRIACRTAEWPEVLEDGLKDLWGETNFKVYELAPLRQIDVKEAAKIEGIDTNKFISEIKNREAQPLAIKPITLIFLINTYKKSGEFPLKQAALYLEGCRILCEETNPSRLAAKHNRKYSPDQLLLVAGRIAALSIYANRYAIFTHINLGDVPDEDLTIKEVCGGVEKLDQESLKVTKDAVWETLSTGLFSSRGQYRLGWAHQTYAEFLAAHYLHKQGLDLPQVMSLICHPGDTEGKLIPQLYETASWLAGMEPSVFREILKLDPKVLLRSDVAAVDVEDKKKLVASLLELIDQKKIYKEDIYRLGHESAIWKA
jgi:predicted NACHT family NTPase